MHKNYINVALPTINLHEFLWITLKKLKAQNTVIVTSKISIFFINSKSC